MHYGMRHVQLKSPRPDEFGCRYFGNGLPTSASLNEITWQWFHPRYKTKVIITAEKTRNSAIADKTRDALRNIQWRG